MAIFHSYVKLPEGIWVIPSETQFQMALITSFVARFCLGVCDGIRGRQLLQMVREQVPAKRGQEWLMWDSHVHEPPILDGLYHGHTM